MNQNQTIYAIQTRSDVIRISLWLPSLPGPAWLSRIDRGEFNISPTARRIMTSPGFRPGCRGKKEIVVLRSDCFSIRHRRTRRIFRDALRRGLSVTYPGLACLLQESLTNEDFASMNLSTLVVAHPPIYIARAQGFRLAVSNNVFGKYLNAFCEDEDKEWGKDVGFVFEESRKY